MVAEPGLGTFPDYVPVLTKVIDKQEKEKQ